MGKNQIDPQLERSEDNSGSSLHPSRTTSSRLPIADAVVAVSEGAAGPVAFWWQLDR
jgi:hypothetical protein